MLVTCVTYSVSVVRIHSIVLCWSRWCVRLGLVVFVVVLFCRLVAGSATSRWVREFFGDDVTRKFGLALASMIARNNWAILHGLSDVVLSYSDLRVIIQCYKQINSIHSFPGPICMPHGFVHSLCLRIARHSVLIQTPFSHHSFERIKFIA